METILIPGGMGFIGSHTAVALIQNGYQVIILDDLSNSSPSVLDGIEQITATRPVFYEGDAADKQTLDRIFSAHRIDAVIHFAGFKAVGESKAAPLSYYCNNLNTTMALLDAMSRYAVKRLVFSSSATVYDSLQYTVLTEATPRTCQSPYGWTKYMSEQIISDFCAATPGTGAVLLRYFNPVGAHESGLIGERPQGVPQNLMPYITQVAIGQREKLSVFGGDYDTPDGTGVRDYIHVSDLAHGHVLALQYSRAHAHCVPFNLGSGKGYSVLELVKAFEEATGVFIPYEITGRRPGDVGIYYADTAHARETLGFTAVRSLADMCRSAYRWEQHVKRLSSHECAVTS